MEKTGWKIDVTDNSENINKDMDGCSFMNTKDWKEIIAILVYWLHDNNEDNGTGVCIEIKNYTEDISFIEERITRAILRESLKEINLFPRELFFESDKKE